jgi:hypothetical protein
MELSDKTLKEICPCAVFRKHRRGEASLCSEIRGKDAPHNIQFLGMQKGEICIGTEIYSTGHSDLDSYIVKEEMEKCPYNPHSPNC